MKMNRTIPFFNYPQIYLSHKEEYDVLIADVLSRGAFINQKDLTEFENSIAHYLGVRHAIGVANCTDGLTIALKAVGIKSGDEVIFPSHTFVATAEAIVNNNGVPVPADIASDHTIDPNDIRKKITKKTKFIMPVQLNGRTSNMDSIKKIAEEHNLAIVEDSAQSLGAKYKGRFAGTWGRVSSFSFYPAKILGAFGDAGIIITNDDDIAQKARFLKDHGRNEKNEVVLWGMNSRLDNLQAAILKFQLTFLNATISRRREIAGLYEKNLKKIRQLILPPGPDSSKDYFDVFQNYEIEAETRDELKSYLANCGIGSMIQWSGKAVHQFGQLGFKTSLPATEKMFTRCLMLPMNVYLSNDDVLYITEKITEFYEKNT